VHQFEIKVFKPFRHFQLKISIIYEAVNSVIQEILPAEQLSYALAYTTVLLSKLHLLSSVHDLPGGK
jgi:hypothetical protein